MSYEALSDTSRVWIYQANRPFTTEEVNELKPALKRFASQWVSHSQQLRAFADVFHQQFIVLMVDESQAGASGCSIDTSVHFIKQIEVAYQVDLFDRMTFTFKDKEKVKTAQREQFAELFKNGEIDENTLVFDNLVKTKKEFEEAWVKPLKSSWHQRMV